MSGFIVAIQAANDKLPGSVFFVITLAHFLNLFKKNNNNKTFLYIYTLYIYVYTHIYIYRHHNILMCIHTNHVNDLTHGVKTSFTTTVAKWKHL